MYLRAYLISDVSVRNAEAFETYPTLAAASISQYGDRYLVRAGPIETLEGGWTPRGIIVIEFADLEHARAWYRSPEYALALAVRQRRLQPQSHPRRWNRHSLIRTDGPHSSSFNHWLLRILEGCRIHNLHFRSSQGSIGCTLASAAIDAPASRTSWRNQRCAGSASVRACHSIETSKPSTGMGSRLTASPAMSAHFSASRRGIVATARSPRSRNGMVRKWDVAAKTKRSA
jgi:uncharacterized protein (DUF1330 family)